MPKKKQQPEQTAYPFERRWVDSCELSRILKISRTTLFNWETKRKILVATPLGGKKYYDLSALEDYMSKNGGNNT
jgi:hypothetical protein